MRLLRSSILKLTKRPATRRTFLVVAGLLALIYLSIGASLASATEPEARADLESNLLFPGGHSQLASILLMFGGLAGAAYAGVVASSEWNWSTYRVALTRGESRGRYVVGLFLAVGLLAAAAWVVLYALGVGFVLLASVIGGVALENPLHGSDPAGLLALVTGGALAVLMETAIGFAVAFVARSQVAGIAAVIGLLLIEQFVGMLVAPDLLRLAPMTAAQNVISIASSDGLAASLALPVGAVAAYLLAAIAVASLIARRAEVA